jgi:hypothetical protein
MGHIYIRHEGGACIIYTSCEGARVICRASRTWLVRVASRCTRALLVVHREGAHGSYMYMQHEGAHASYTHRARAHESYVVPRVHGWCGWHLDAHERYSWCIVRVRMGRIYVYGVRGRTRHIHIVRGRTSHMSCLAYMVGAGSISMHTRATRGAS